jgi:hypothetical protein
MNLDIGVIRRGQIPALQAPATVSAAAAFAAALGRRHLPRAVIVSRVDLALAQEPAAQVSYFHSAPRIDIAPAVSIQERYTLFAGEPAGAKGYGEAEASALFERLFSRHIRVAPFAAPNAPDARREGESAQTFTRPPDILPRVDTVDRVLPRLPVSMERVSSPPERAPLTQPALRDMDWGTGWGQRPIRASGPQPMTLPAPEFGRVVDQVMREIDRRIVARRERLGKR